MFIYIMIYKVHNYKKTPGYWRSEGTDCSVYWDFPGSLAVQT